MKSSTNAWTQAEDDLLAKLWGEGKSASQIAARMSGRTRNSVIGRVHRKRSGGAKVAKRVMQPPRSSRRYRKPALAAAPAPKAGPSLAPLTTKAIALRAPPAKPLPPRQPGKPVTLLALGTRQCRFAVSGEGGHKDPFKFCGAGTSENSSWCEHHEAVVFNGFQRVSLRKLQTSQKTNEGAFR